MRSLTWNIVVLGAVLGAASCHPSDSSSGTSATEETGTASSEDGAASPRAGAQPRPASGTASGGAAGTSSGAATDDGGGDTPLAVDVGNPEETGPKPEEQGKLKLYLADAPVADGLDGLLVRPVALELRDALGATKFVRTLDGSAIDLAAYREGAKLLLFEGDVPIGRYTEIRILLDPDQPATAVRGGDEIPVLVPGTIAAQGGAVILNDPKALFGDLELVVAKDRTADVTMHVDLRRQLKAITDGLPLGWLVFGPDAEYWLDPESATFLSDAVGAIEGLGLSLLTKVACVYKVDASTPLNILGIPLLTGADTNSSCAQAQGSAVVHDLFFRVPFLPPGTYAVRLFVGDLAYVDVPGLHVVTEGLVTALEL